MKNLANCTPTEFLRQTMRIKKTAEKWLDATKILEIRKEAPDIKVITPDMTDDERKAAEKYNRKMREAQVKKNFSRMLDAMMDENPDLTLQLLALTCFVEPESVDEHTMDEYLTALSEMIGSEAVLSFFTSLARWGLMNTKA